LPRFNVEDEFPRPLFLADFPPPPRGGAEAIKTDIVISRKTVIIRLDILFMTFLLSNKFDSDNAFLMPMKIRYILVFSYNY
jgi:hypothetical protein